LFSKIVMFFDLQLEAAARQDSGETYAKLFYEIVQVYEFCVEISTPPMQKY